LRNIRNIVELFDDNAELIAVLCQKLTNTEAIRKSKVLPFRFTTAYTTCTKDLADKNSMTKIIIALNQAIDASLVNLPEFSGKTLIVCDYSGSMGNNYDDPKGKGTLFASALLRKNPSNADFMCFGDNAKYVAVNPTDSTMTIYEKLMLVNTRTDYVGHGTNFHSIFESASKKYDRIIIFSDMQGWIGYECPAVEHNMYKKKYSCNPKVFSFDLQGYGSLQFPEPEVFCLSGWSENTLTVMDLLDKGNKNAFLDEIELVNLRDK